MKKALLLLAASAFATASFAQTAPATSTEVKVRDNGTEKIVTERADGSKTVTKTGKTNVGKALDNTVDAAGNVAKKAGHGIKRGAKKAGHAVKRGTQKVGKKLDKGTAEMEAKTE